MMVFAIRVRTYHTLGVDCAQIRVLEQPSEVRLSGLLQRSDGAGLEAQVRVEILCYLANEALER